MQNPKDNSLSAQNVPNTSRQNCKESVEIISNNEEIDAIAALQHSMDPSLSTDGEMNLNIDALQNAESMIDCPEQKDNAEMDKKNLYVSNYFLRIF